LTVALVSIWVLVSTTLMATAFYTMTAEGILSRSSRLSRLGRRVAGGFRADTRPPPFKPLTVEQFPPDLRR